MKRKMFSILAIAAIAMTSCKKDEVVTTELRDAVITGNVWADMDQTDNDIEGVEGMTVKVELNTQNWDQQPDLAYDYDVRVYTAVTDANGDYTLTIPATEDGFNVAIEFEDLYTTRTTASGAQDVKVTRANKTVAIYAGAAVSTKDEGTVSEANGSSATGGEAWITGKVNIVYDNTGWQAPAVPVGDQVLNTASGKGAKDVMWYYNAATGPFGATDNTTYSMAVNLTAGTYTLTIPTEGLSGAGVTVDYGILDFEGTQVQDNQAGTADSTVTGIYSMGGASYTTTVNAGDLINQDITFGFAAY